MTAVKLDKAWTDGDGDDVRIGADDGRSDERHNPTAVAYVYACNGCYLTRPQLAEVLEYLQGIYEDTAPPQPRFYRNHKGEVFDRATPFSNPTGHYCLVPENYATWFTDAHLALLNKGAES